jgi:hypothetical protein
VAKNANDDHAVKTTKGDTQSRERWADLRTTEWNDDDWKTPTVSDTVEKPESFAEIVANKSIYSAMFATTASIHGGRGRGRGQGMGNVATDVRTNMLAPPAISRLMGSNVSINSNASANSGGFQVVKNKKKERQKNRVVIGQSQVDCNIKGAPEQERDLFIFQLVQETTCADLENYVKGNVFTVREIECKSHEDAKY